MIARHLFRCFVAHLLPVLLLGWGAGAMAQSDPSGRVARLNHSEGPVAFSAAGDNEWTDAVFNRPLTRGDRLWADKGSRAELQVGSSAVRMDGLTRLEILALDDQSAQLSLTQGTIYVRVRSLPEGENFEIDTPNLAYRAAYPGDYRIDVDAVNGTTRVTIHSGTGAVYGEGGQVLPLGGGQQVTFRARTLAKVNAQEAPPQDAFDRWAADRNRREDQSVAARYVPREVVGYQQLDAHGQWSQDATHGAVWIPQGVPANWAPYRMGHWEWITPWGWTWLDDAPWGFAPFHYGRWALIGSRWAWAPGRIGLRPVYAPALVAFIGGVSGGVNWNIALGGGKPGVAWFPLAPGEAWQPGYRVSPVYMSNVNRSMVVQPNAVYAHQHRPEALTAISTDDFHRGRPVRGNGFKVAANTLASAQVIPPPPMPERSGVLERPHAGPVRAGPPPQPDIRQVAAAPAPVPAQPRPDEVAERAKREREAQVQAQAKAAQIQAAQAAQAKAQAQAKADLAAQQAQAKAAQAQAALEAQAKAQAALATQQAEAQIVAQRKAEAQRLRAAGEQQRQQASRAVQAKAAGQLRRELAAQRAELAKREQQAVRVGLARRDQQAKRGEKAKREQLALRTEPGKKDLPGTRAEKTRREQLARREEAKRDVAARRELLAKKTDQARREELAKREEKLRREAVAKQEEQERKEAHAQQVEQARRAADRDAQVLREARAKREEQARREAQEKETAQRAAWQRQQQALTEQWRRDQQAWEQHQRDRGRQRPGLRDEPRPVAPEVWQRGIPVVTPPGRTS